MKIRYIFLMIGLTFAVTLAINISDRISADAMAVTVGVVAGIVASIPTSLIVVWLTSRTHPEPLAAPASMPQDRAEPQVIMMAPPMMTPMMMQAYQQQVPYQNAAGYAPSAYPAYQFPQPLQQIAPPTPPRRFTIIGGADVAIDDAEPLETLTWHR